jgi:hypothetical protein
MSPQVSETELGSAPDTPIICYKKPMRRHDYLPRPAHIKWLLDSDPSIRWQVMRDITNEDPDTIAAERSRIATDGWGQNSCPSNLPAAVGAGQTKIEACSLRSTVWLC